MRITKRKLALLIGAVVLGTVLATNFLHTDQATVKPSANAPIVTSAPVSPGTALPAPATINAAIHQVHSPGMVTDDMHLSAGQCQVRTLDAAAGNVLPDPKCTPGGADPAVTQANIQSTICVKGYTKTIRPPATDTGKFKTLSYVQYGLVHSRTVEYDHLISLELGGTNSVSNLWPEVNRSSATTFSNPKDPVENKLAAAVCSGKVTLVAAQEAIATNWTTALNKLGL